MVVCEAEEDWVGQIYKDYEKILKVCSHSFYYSKAGTLYVNLSCVTDPVVNFIHFHGLNHYQFCEFLSEKEAEWPDSTVVW